MRIYAKRGLEPRHFDRGGFDAPALSTQEDEPDPLHEHLLAAAENEGMVWRGRDEEGR